MSQFVQFYLTVGLGVYLGASASRWDTFLSTKSTWHLVKGLSIGLLLWPLGLILLFYARKKEISK